MFCYVQPPASPDVLLPSPPSNSTAHDPELPDEVRSLMSVFAMPDIPVPEDTLSLQEGNVLTYIGGYIVRKLCSKVCTDCAEKMTSEADVENPNHMFLVEKNYSHAKEGLKVPSDILVQCLESIEKEYIRVIDDNVFKDGVKKILVGSILKYVNMEELVCEYCKCHLSIVNLYVNIRLHHSIRLANRQLRDQKERKNRKVLKFSHM